MNPARHRYAALVPGLVLCSLAAAAGEALAQTTGAPYVDRVIEGLPAETEAGTGDDIQDSYDAAGWPRYVRLEARVGTEPFDTRHRTRAGMAVYGLLETPNHGVLSVDGTHSPQSGGGTLTLRQRELPLGNGWTANHEAGVINSPLPPASRLPSRVYLPTALMQGIGGDWTRNDGTWQWQAAAGQPGRLDGLPSSVWRSGSGERQSLGFQWRPDPMPAGRFDLHPPGWTWAVQAESARGVALVDNPLPGERFDADGVLLVTRHEQPGRRLQAQWVHAGGGPAGGQRQGFWADAEWEDGPRRHGAGIYRLDPALHWAGQPMASDAQGLHARSSWRSRQWSADGSIDWLRSVSGTRGEGYYATVSGRRRLGPGSQLGAGMALRDFDGRAWSAYTDWRRDNTWGNSGWRLDWTGGQNRAPEQRLSYDQDWRVPQGWTLATSFGLGHVGAYAGLAAQSLWAAAVSLSAPVGARAGVRGSLDTERRSGGERRYSLSLGGTWRIDTRWSIEGQFNRSLGRSSSLPLDPLAPPPTVLTSGDRSFYAVLRYEWQAGSRQTPLGGRLRDGGGRVEGVVYLDGNRSGTREASEQGAGNVTVLLDNRYTVRTDAQGRFEFPFVAAGRHTLTVRNDTLPLPWSVVGDGQVTVEVQVRGDSQLSIPVQRMD